MSMLSPLTELDAVNEMLMSIGQAPVSTLTITGGDVNLARAFLTGVVRYVQLKGFAFNTDEDYLISPDINGVIAVPMGVLKADPMDKNQRIVMRRHPGGSMAFWDAANNTWTMSAPVAFRVTWAFPFADLPESAKNYITVSAARKFQKRVIGSDELDGYNAEDEQRAWALLLADERTIRDTNLFKSNPSLRRYANRSGRRTVTD